MRNHGRVRHIENREAGHSVWMQQRHTPGDNRSPIVAGDMHPVLAELVDDGDHVGDELRHSISAHLRGFAAGVVSALIESDHAKTGCGQGTNLLTPSVPELREPMQQDDDRAVTRTGCDSVQFDARVGKPQLLEIKGV